MFFFSFFETNLFHWGIIASQYFLNHFLKQIYFIGGYLLHIFYNLKKIYFIGG